MTVHIQIHRRTSDDDGSIVERDAFLYDEPSGDGDVFAQCRTCGFFNAQAGRCKALRPKDVVKATMSCGYYHEGENTIDPPQSWFSPIEVGLVDRSVRCENCAAFDGQGKCNLYEMLNKEYPKLFKLDTRVKPKACCNAQHTD